MTGPVDMVLKYPGSKGSMRNTIIDLMPAHKRYCEPYGGSAAVLLAKPPVAVEWFNDVNQDVINLFSIIREQGAALSKLCRWVEATPYSRATLESARAQDVADTSAVAQAWRFLVRSWFSLNGSLANQRTGWRCSTQDSKRLITWTHLPARLEAAAVRFRNVHIDNIDAVKLMLIMDGADVVFYVDPPYMVDTINFREKQVYSTAFLNSDHEDLLTCLVNLKGKVILSGYRHGLYDQRLTDWQRIDVPHRTQRQSVKTECLWLNFRAPS